ncbi:hypothetical protein Pedsa_0970 [Pseudopedobacter saltans DSM 12145]|uniref:Sulfate transporter n=1 Tax=Pseudopedobacter saltans (strain ATCC 51119 / DSM 12145 / JCM 21818 / CCUG 39354 / LMG 10337 / NBRC 100064 / NCIMB 13643) TaxID=762903 RepID=F0SAU7_PSESL|nr:DUF3164 family protein [Pseudopedobacter saltans]ADY51542.1 hypothetical protein Pedsa_0970 [Pseudopedobacter saltans DSM 12145]
MLKINQQKPNSPKWTDEAGTAIPYNRTTNYERKAERFTAKYAQKALNLNEALTAFKTALSKEVDELYDAFVKEKGSELGKGKGSITIYNFDRSIKIVCSVKEAITFDENTLGLAKRELDEMFKDNLSGVDNWVAEMVTDAFSNTKGNFDTKQILGLKRHKSKVPDQRYHKAMDLIEQAIRRPKSKEYHQVFIKDAAGEYINVQLNFASV